MDSNPISPLTEARLSGFLSAPQFFPEGEPVVNFVLPTILSASDINITEPRYGARLGHLAEHFFEAAIKASDRYEILDSHIQIIVDGRTLGELDYITFDRDSQAITHVELAFKFYLLDPAIPDPEAARWIGPNQNDSLLLKIKKLRERQLPLLQHPATRSVLLQKGFAAEAIQQALCIKGHFFIPFDFNGPLPDAYKNMVTGVWMRRKDFTQDRMQDSVFAAIQKHDWLIDLTNGTPDNCFNWMDKTSALEHIDACHSSSQSLMIWSKHPDHTYHRICVVWW